MSVATQQSFGQLVRRYRRDVELTQEALAERAGVSVRAVQGIEAGSNHRPRQDTLQLLMDALAVPEGEQRSFLAAAYQGAETHAPLQPMPMSHPTNLPDEPTRFIGREQETEQLVALVREPHIRLVTLTGPGGTGKTRLALQVARTLLNEYPDGVFFVDLAPLADSSLVPSAVAAVLNVLDAADQTLVERLVDVLRARHLLLVLDNFEHLLAAAPLVASLLDACRELHVLVTSRAPLHLVREYEHVVPALSVPDPQNLPSLDALSKYEAFALFVERAQAARDTFTVTNATAPAIAEICSRLDGLPLAIELAAARIRLFPPQALLHRLSSCLTLLVGGAQDQPARQQTLRNTIEWSFLLLSAKEQTLFARLSVFAGGATLEAAEAVCDPDGELDLVEGAGFLVEQSLLRQVGDDEPRFVMLETTREYAAGKLAESGQKADIEHRHALYFLAHAEGVQAGLDPLRPELSLDRLEVELDNLRAAVRWSVDHSDVEMGLRIAAAFIDSLPLASWSYHTEEAWGWCQTLLTLDRSMVSPGLRTSALLSAALAAQLTGHAHQARSLVDEIIPLVSELDDKRERAALAGDVGWLLRELGDYARAGTMLETALSLFRELGDERRVAGTLLSLGEVAREQGDPETTVKFCRESLRLYRDLGDGEGTAWSLYDLGLAAWMTGELEQATRLYDQSMRMMHEVGIEVGMPEALTAVALVVRDEGDLDAAERVLLDALWFCEVRKTYVYPAPMALEGMAGVATARGQCDRATRLFGASDSLRRRIGFSPWPVLRRRHEADLSAVREALGPEQFSQAWEVGQAMTMEQAIAFAMGPIEQKSRSR